VLEQRVTTERERPQIFGRDLISYQNDGKVGMVIVGEVGMA
jgi:hypothetical protein